MTGVSGVSQDDGCCSQQAFLGQTLYVSVTPILFSADLTTLLRAFMDEVLRVFVPDRDMLLVKMLSMV